MGIIGHDVLATFFSALKSGENVEKAAAEAFTVIDKLIVEAIGGEPEVMDMLADLRKRISEYMLEEIPEQDFLSVYDIEEVERDYRITLPSGVEYAMRLDLLLTAKTGPYKGQLILMDHKFVWDFYTPAQVRFNSQMPKYIGILRQNGIPVKTAILNQIRTRVNKGPMPRDNRFKQAALTPSKRRIEQLFVDDAKTAAEIEFLRGLSLDNWEQDVTRNMSTMACKFCSYKTLCDAKLEGEDVTVMLKHDYEPLEYGYEHSSASE
jgi:hypothetical protein